MSDSTIQIDRSTGLSIKINEAKLERAIAKAVTAALKERLRQGRGAKGPIPPGVKTENKRPMNDTGGLIRSIKFKPARRSSKTNPSTTGKPKRPGRIEADGYHKADKEGDRRPNPVLMNDALKNRRGVAEADPMGVDAELQRVANGAARIEIRRQAIAHEIKIQRGRGG